MSALAPSPRPPHSLPPPHTRLRFGRARCPAARLAAVLAFGLLAHATALAAEATAGSAATAHAPTPGAWAEAEADASRLQLATGLRLEVWATEPMLENPVAFSLSPLPPSAPGRPPGVAATIAETHRYGVSVLDITQTTPRLLDDLSLRSTEGRADLLARHFGTNAAVLTRDSEILRRVADTDADGRADRSSVFAGGFSSPLDGTAAGVLAHGNDVWFANIPHLWRLPAAPGDDPPPGSPRPRTALASGFGVHIGVTGHDLHGLVLGPDGRLYFSFGDRGIRVTTAEGRTLDLPDTGGVLRCEPDGNHLEVFCTGLRNPQELAFDDHGTLFTVDNDTAGADDCRVLHLVQGADYGWRSSYQHMKGFGPWVREGLWAGGLDGILPPAGKVSQGPAGLTWYPGTGFGDRFRGRFLHADFPGGIWSFTVEPRGASYAVADPRKVLWNCWPTDVEFGPDGALYVLDWVSGWGIRQRGRIHRITPDPASLPADAPASDTVAALLSRDAAGLGEAELLRGLAHPDRRVRFQAQFELARRGPASFGALRGIAFQATATLPRLHALWAIGQIARRIPVGGTPTDRSDELASLLRLLDDGDPVVAGAAGTILAEAALMHVDRPLAALARDPSPRLRFDAAMAYGTLMVGEFRTSPSLPQRAVRWLEEHLPQAGRAASRLVDTSDTFHPGGDTLPEFVRSFVGRDPFLEYAAARHAARLERLEATWGSYRGLSTGLRALATDAQPQVRQVALLALRQLTNAALASFLADPDPLLTLGAARAIHDLPVPEALPALAAELGPRPTGAPAPAWHRVPDFPLRAHLDATRLPVPHLPQPPAAPVSLRLQFLRRALNAHFRLGQESNATALATFAATPSESAGNEPLPSVPEEARIEALFLLSQWEVPAAEPGRVPALIVPDANHGMEPSINPENWPGWFDRVIGLWRPLPPRPADAARRALAPQLPPLLAGQSAALTLASIQAAVRLRLTDAGPRLFALLEDPRQPAAVRESIPGALAGLDSPLAGQAVRLALEDPDPRLRAAAVPHLDRLPPESALPLLRRLLDQGLAPQGNLTLAQAALDALGRRPEPETDTLLAGLVERHATGPWPPELELELREALQARPNPALAERLGRTSTASPSPDPLAAWSDVLAGGDPARGRRLFFEKTEVQCSRCHRVGAEGGTVGPSLDGLGTREPRPRILESILLPNARFAPGFESARLDLADGGSVSGTIRRETETEAVVDTGEDGEVTIPKSRILRRQPGLSAMPEGLAALLTRRELRDLLAFLAQLRSP